MTISKPFYFSIQQFLGLIPPGKTFENICKYVKSAYNPEVLNMASKHNLDIKSICRNGIILICNYYGIHMFDIEIHDLAVMFSYRSDSSKDPITNRSGMMARQLGWIETFEATDYTKLPSLETDMFEIADTSTASMFISNFNNMRDKYE